MKINFLQSGSADSEIRTITANPVGGFTGTIALSITTSPTLPGGATIKYSWNGGAYAANPTTNMAYNSSATLRTQVSKKVTGQYTITVTGTSPGYIDVTKNFTLDAKGFTPAFQEF